MNIQLEQLYGIWRYNYNGVITDFNVRNYNEKDDSGYSIFTVYERAVSGSKIVYEWIGVPEIINYPDHISTITIKNIKNTEDNPKYQNLKIWHFTNNLMILEFGDGTRAEFQKIGT